ncbi:hypothetical protein ACHAW5_010399 [Stephanodiscus triporus]|uniref:Uncharacterized protein n=1 Tax=Stephanodiscus triporus TaxID=2934178 RepID=A0ABD3Q4Y8_9STRA
MDVTDNVLYLLSSKMSGLSPSIQSALKIAACFGIKIREAVVAVLGNVPEQSDIRDRLEQIVKEGFMVKGDTSDFVFVHDKVREAAYSLIPEKEKDKFHYSLGLSLYSMTKGKLVDDLIITIADQIKHGIDKIIDYPELRIGIAEINELAGMQAAACSDHVASRSYLTYALTLLPTDHWKSHYDQSLRVSLRLAKSCYSCGDVGKAQRILQEVTGQSHSIEDKIPAYALLARILLERKRFMEAYTLCHGVLSQLGEEVPDSLQLSQVSEMVVLTLKMVHKISDKDLLEMKEIDIKVNHCMNFYYIMNKAAFFGKPEMLPVVACRMTQLTMENGLCKYSIVGLVDFASVICLNKFAFSKKIEKNVIESASRIGKAAMSCSTTRYPTTEQLPNLYLSYYGFLAHHTVPLHICADMLRQGFDVGMSLGDPGVAFFNSIQHIKTAFIAGDRLPTLLEKVDYYLKLTNTYQNEIAKVFLSLQRETISILIDNEGTSSSTPQAIDAPTNSTNAHLIELIYYHRAIQAYWRGHSERCQHYIGKFLQSSFQAGKLISMVIVFIHGMNSFQLLKRRSSIKNTSISKKSIRALKTAAKHSRWNFINKKLKSFHIVVARMRPKHPTLPPSAPLAHLDSFMSKV